MLLWRRQLTQAKIASLGEQLSEVRDSLATTRASLETSVAQASAPCEL